MCVLGGGRVGGWCGGGVGVGGGIILFDDAVQSKSVGSFSWSTHMSVDNLMALGLHSFWVMFQQNRFHNCAWTGLDPCPTSQTGI